MAEAQKMVKWMSIFPTHKIIVQGALLSKEVVAGRVIVKKTRGAKVLAFQDNEAEAPEDWTEFLDDSTGEVTGLKHALGYRNDFIEKDELLKGLRNKKARWADSFLERMNKRRMIVNPSLGELDKMDLLGLRPD